MAWISCRALLIVFMQTSCSSHFGLCYSHPFDLWNAKTRLNTVDKRQGGPSQFCLCFLSKAAVGCYRRLSTEASALPNPKCANCASAKSAKARFEFLPVAPVLVSGLRGLAPSLIVRVSQQTERADDMSSSPIRSKVLCIPLLHPSRASSLLSSDCRIVRGNRASLRLVRTPTQLHVAPSKSQYQGLTYRIRMRCPHGTHTVQRTHVFCDYQSWGVSVLSCCVHERAVKSPFLPGETLVAQPLQSGLGYFSK